MTSTLLLLRHGESTWNAENLFTGWWDVDLSPNGEKEATHAGTLLADAGFAPDIVHTSVLTRAIRTADLALAAMGLSWLPVRRHWRLNERHYGDLTGRNKAETAERFGDKQVALWRRSYDVPPPPIAADNRHNPNGDRRYSGLSPDVVPATECLADVVERMLPYWYDAIVPDLAAGRQTFVVAHGNSLRALVKHLDHLDDEAIVGLNVPTGMPLVYDLSDEFMPTIAVDDPLDRALDPDAARAGAQKVASQTKG